MQSRLRQDQSKGIVMKFFCTANIMILLIGEIILFPADIIRADDQVITSPAEYLTLDDLFTLYQPYLGNISAYEPIYFLVGVNPEDSKFQFSFRYRFFNPEGPLAANHPWVNGLNFGYTQTSFWDLKSESIPFEDTSYKPELFHLTTNLSSRPDWMQGLFLQSGLRHESNGQGEDNSRSTNTFYLKPIMIFFDQKSELGLQIAPKVWIYVDNNSDNNKDLPDYRGYFELEIKAGKAEGLVAGTTLRWAKEGGSVKIDLTYPLHQYLSDNLAVYLQAQYVNNLAESLLYYQERTDAFRLGLSFVR
ncbi:MAG: phospholipase A [Proteobacteria bacterium]|nr:phospholipase A [Pseudomonadota bacterium]MBU1715624.1 phospholipase A [Pseudomonadota bacterium]